MVIKGEVVGGEWVKQIKDIESIFITISSEECTKLQKKKIAFLKALQFFTILYTYYLVIVIGMITLRKVIKSPFQIRLAVIVILYLLGF